MVRGQGNGSSRKFALFAAFLVLGTENISSAEIIGTKYVRLTKILGNSACMYFMHNLPPKWKNIGSAEMEKEKVPQECIIRAYPSVSPLGRSQEPLSKVDDRFSTVEYGRFPLHRLTEICFDFSHKLEQGTELKGVSHFRMVCGSTLSDTGLRAHFLSQKRSAHKNAGKGERSLWDRTKWALCQLGRYVGLYIE
jgi:hypothetical protein